MGARGSYLLGESPKNFGTSNADLVDEASDSGRTRASMNQSRLEKGLFLIIFFATTLCIILLVARISSATTSHEEGIVNGSVSSFFANIDGQTVEMCNTKECITAAAQILDSMDKSVDPCQDFYSFACGNWKKNHPLPPTMGKWSHFNALSTKVERQIWDILQIPQNLSDPLPLNQAKVFYEACANVTLGDTVGLKPLVDFLDQFGGWPMALNESSWNQKLFNLSNAISESRRQLGAGLIFAVSVSADQRSPLNNSLYIDQTTLGMSRSILVDPEHYKNDIEKYKNSMKAKVNLIGSYLESNLSDDTLNKDVEDVVAFEMKLANMTEPNSNRRVVDRMYNPMTVGELQQNFTQSDLVWLDMLYKIFKSTHIDITNETRVIVTELDYTAKVQSLITDTPKRILSNYISWRLILILGGETTQKMRDTIVEDKSVKEKLRFDKSRSAHCVFQTNAFLGMAVGVEYIRINFCNETKSIVNMMVEDIESAFKDLLAINQWMDADTIPLAVEKADYIKKYIAYPDWFNSSEKLVEYYSGLFGISNRSHFANILVMGLYYSSYELSQLDKPVNRSQWMTHPAEVNAFYSAEHNSITFPAGILQPPFYRVNTPHYMSYGGIGQVIGHEITHGFDDQGRQFNKEGHEGPWWTNDTIEAFKLKEQCIIDQYSGFKIPEINATINGNTTQGENIADNGGLREAYLAYLKYAQRHGRDESRLPGLNQFTPLQMFFISNANIWCATSSPAGMLSQVMNDPHSYQKYRVNGPMGNMVEFADNFNCPLGSPMNPRDKCVVW